MIAGSHDGARYAEMFYRFFATCTKNDINYYDWLVYVMENINDTKKSELINLLPHRIYPALLTHVGSIEKTTNPALQK